MKRLHFGKNFKQKSKTEKIKKNFSNKKETKLN